MNEFEREFGRMQSEELSIFDSLTESERDKLADYIREYGYGQYDAGYDTGYADGTAEAQTAYDEGYEAGVMDGQDERCAMDYDEGYTAGYADGRAECE